MQKYCKCFNCARLASCPIAGAAIKQCRQYVESKMSNTEIARVIGCTPDTIVELKRSMDGIKFLTVKLKNLGYDCRVDMSGKRVFFWRKERFQRDRQIELAQLGVYVALLAQSAQQQNYTGAI